MAFNDRDYAQPRTFADATVTSFANRVYGWMTIGLAFTALVALFVVRSGLYISLQPMWWVFAFGTLGVALAIQGMVEKLSFAGMAGLFLTYAGLEGCFFGVVLPMYAAASGGQVIWLAFATAAFVSAAAVAYGYFTKSDLTQLGRLFSFGLMALIGLTLIYFVASFWVHLTWMHLLISYLGLVLFIGLTAYDSQQIRWMSYQASSQSTAAGKMSLIMALKMYINVIMIFWYLLQIFSRRD